MLYLELFDCGLRRQLLRKSHAGVALAIITACGLNISTGAPAQIRLENRPPKAVLLTKWTQKAVIPNVDLTVNAHDYAISQLFDALLYLLLLFLCLLKKCFYVVFPCKIKYRKVIQSCDGKPENAVVSE
jgi:hypothetical protein